MDDRGTARYGRTCRYEPSILIAISRSMILRTSSSGQFGAKLLYFEVGRIQVRWTRKSTNAKKEREKGGRVSLESTLAYRGIEFAAALGFTNLVEKRPHLWDVLKILVVDFV
jgi:hypothetical protein